MKSTKGIFKKITDWESWPFGVLYAPLSVFWIWYTIRSGSIWFFTSSNPKITFGGMAGEPKKEMYELLPPALYPATFFVQPNEALSAVKQKRIAHGINYPFIVKPEIGEQGILLRKIDNEAAFDKYHGSMPWEYIVQDLVRYPMEVSVFYIRHPLQTKGTVTGFLQKIPLQVTGDGKQTLAELVTAHPKAGRRLAELSNKHRQNWQQVVPAGERYLLSIAANHNRGASFIDLKEHIDDRLVAVFDAISLGINDFFYGRYDIMCAGIGDLKCGKNFTILEYNGCGAEPNHFYDTGYSLIGAYKEILKHWRALYRICKYNRRQGIKPWAFKKGINFVKFIRQHSREIKAADASMG